MGAIGNMKNDWWSCDGTGNAGDRAIRNTVSVNPTVEPTARLSVTRRNLLLGTALAAVGWAARETTALADVTIDPHGKEHDKDILVNIFLRGGADGLNIVVPHGEDAYHKKRPVVGVPGPKDTKAGPLERAIDLDGFFGLHPALRPFEPLYKDGLLAAVHACGSGDLSRSHFEAMSTMERGLKNSAGAASGWIARHLMASEGHNSSPLRAVAFSAVMPESLRGATDATAINSLADFRLFVPQTNELSETRELHKALAEFYSDGKDTIAQAGRETLAVLDTLNKLDPAKYLPANGAAYPTSYLGSGLKQVACLIKGKVGLEVACLDRGGWDMHYGQNLGNWMATELGDVATCLAAFCKDLKTDMGRVTIVLMTEFGRRVEENKTLGTDHGYGGAMFVLGGGINGGQVYGKWPGLEDHQLEDPGDLKVTTDYRDVLSEILTKRLRNEKLGSVFPEYSSRSIGIAKAA